MGGTGKESARTCIHAVRIKCNLMLIVFGRERIKVSGPVLNKFVIFSNLRGITEPGLKKRPSYFLKASAFMVETGEKSLNISADQKITNK